mgnify:CR=1 FL=1
MKRFLSIAQVGKNLEVGVHSNCTAEKKGLIKIGDNCAIAGSLYSMADGKIEIGDYTEIRENSVVGSVESVKIGSYVMISNNIRIYDNNNHPTDPAKRKEMCKNGFYGEAWRWTYWDHKPVVIEDNVWIGQYVTILKGVRIGKGAIIGTKAVVTKDVPENTIVAGNPARIVKKLENE